MRAPFFPSPRISSPPPLFALVLHLPESLFRVVIKSPFDSTIVRFLGDACSREGHALRNGDRMQIRPGHRKTLLKFCLYAVIMPTYDACDPVRGSRVSRKEAGPVIAVPSDTHGALVTLLPLTFDRTSFSVGPFFTRIYSENVLPLIQFIIRLPSANVNPSITQFDYFLNLIFVPIIASRNDLCAQTDLVES